MQSVNAVRSSGCVTVPVIGCGRPLRWCHVAQWANWSAAGSERSAVFCFCSVPLKSWVHSEHGLFEFNTSSGFTVDIPHSKHSKWWFSVCWREELSEKMCLCFIFYIHDSLLESKVHIHLQKGTQHELYDDQSSYFALSPLSVMTKPLSCFVFTVGPRYQLSQSPHDFLCTTYDFHCGIKTNVDRFSTVSVPGEK